MSFKFQDSSFKPGGGRSAPSLPWGMGINVRLRSEATARQASRWYIAKNGQKCICKRMICRSLGRKPRFFRVFIAFNGLIFRPLRRMCLVFFAAAASATESEARSVSRAGREGHKGDCAQPSHGETREPVAPSQTQSESVRPNQTKIWRGREPCECGIRTEEWVWGESTAKDAKCAKWKGKCQGRCGKRPYHARMRFRRPPASGNYGATCKWLNLSIMRMVICIWEWFTWLPCRNVSECVGLPTARGVGFGARVLVNAAFGDFGGLSRVVRKAQCGVSARRRNGPAGRGCYPERRANQRPPSSRVRDYGAICKWLISRICEGIFAIGQREGSQV